MNSLKLLMADHISFLLEVHTFCQALGVSNPLNGQGNDMNVFLSMDADSQF